MDFSDLLRHALPGCGASERCGATSWRRRQLVSPLSVRRSPLLSSLHGDQTRDTKTCTRSILLGSCAPPPRPPSAALLPAVLCSSLFLSQTAPFSRLLLLSNRIPMAPYPTSAVAFTWNASATEDRSRELFLSTAAVKLRATERENALAALSLLWPTSACSSPSIRGSPQRSRDGSALIPSPQTERSTKTRCSRQLLFRR